MDEYQNLTSRNDTLYNILEVPKTATAEEIKKSYRRLALKHHPDKNPNNDEATEKFKEINHANRILSDPAKKRIYDDHGTLGLYIAEQFGEENAKTYFVITSTLSKVLLLICVILTGCFFCFCLFCCCKFFSSMFGFGIPDASEYQGDASIEDVVPITTQPLLDDQCARSISIMPPAQEMEECPIPNRHNVSN